MNAQIQITLEEAERLLAKELKRPGDFSNITVKITKPDARPEDLSKIQLCKLIRLATRYSILLNECKPGEINDRGTLGLKAAKELAEALMSNMTNHEKIMNATNYQECFWGA